jgi:hypothetical protein
MTDSGQAPRSISPCPRQRLPTPGNRTQSTTQYLVFTTSSIIRINSNINLAIIEVVQLPPSTTWIITSASSNQSPESPETNIPIERESRIDIDPEENRRGGTIISSEGDIVVGPLVKPPKQISGVSMTVIESTCSGIIAELAFGSEELILENPASGIVALWVSRALDREAVGGDFTREKIGGELELGRAGSRWGLVGVDY